MEGRNVCMPVWQEQRVGVKNRWVHTPALPLYGVGVGGWGEEDGVTTSQASVSHLSGFEVQVRMTWSHVSKALSMAPHLEQVLSKWQLVPSLRFLLWVCQGLLVLIILLISFRRILHWTLLFCSQVWRWVYDSCPHSRVQPGPEACPGVLRTGLPGQRPEGEAPEHAAVPAPVLAVVPGQDLQHPLPEQEAPPHRRLLRFADNTWPSKRGRATIDLFSRERSPAPFLTPFWALEQYRLDEFEFPSFYC